MSIQSSSRPTRPRGFSTSRLILFSALGILGTSGCGGGTPSPFRGAEPERTTDLRVENRNWSDMTILVFRGGNRQRLGLVSTNQIRTFVIPRDMVAGGASLVFEADPVGSNESYRSPSLSLSGGERIHWTLMANLAQSTLTYR